MASKQTLILSLILLERPHLESCPHPHLHTLTGLQCRKLPSSSFPEVQCFAALQESSAVGLQCPMGKEILELARLEAVKYSAKLTELKLRF